MSQKTDYTAWHQDQPDEGLDKAVERIERRGKAILVMDMPKCCGECCLHYWGNQRMHCLWTWDDLSTLTSKPDWCPLVPAISYVEPVGNMISWEDEE